VKKKEPASVIEGQVSRSSLPLPDNQKNISPRSHSNFIPSSESTNHPVKSPLSVLSTGGGES